MTIPETRARELLAAEYEAVGDALNSGRIIAGFYVCEEVDLALRAIQAALAQSGELSVDDRPLNTSGVDCRETGFDERQALRASIVEECAKVAENWGPGKGMANSIACSIRIATAIRAISRGDHLSTGRG